MLVVLRSFFLFGLRALTGSRTLTRCGTLMLLFLCLHALDHFFFLRIVAECLKEINDLAVRILSFFQGILHPAVRLSAHINKEVALRDLCDIVGSRLIAVQINTVVEEQRELCVLCLVTENLPHPVILRENGRDNL